MIRVRGHENSLVCLSNVRLDRDDMRSQDVVMGGLRRVQFGFISSFGEPLITVWFGLVSTLASIPSRTIVCGKLQSVSRAVQIFSVDCVASCPPSLQPVVDQSRLSTPQCMYSRYHIIETAAGRGLDLRLLLVAPCFTHWHFLIELMRRSPLSDEAEVISGCHKTYIKPLEPVPRPSFTMSYHIPTTQVAAVVPGPKQSVVVRRDVPVTQPSALKPGQCLVKLICTGVCHTDLHVSRCDWPVKATTPLIGGHEGVGEVVAISENTEVSPVKLGQRVGIKWIAYSCRDCEQCRKGLEQSG